MEKSTNDLSKLLNNEIPGDQDVKKIIIEDGFLIIKHRNDFDYDIALERIDDYKKIVGWIAHLSEKTWFTNEVLDCFLNVLNGHFNGIIDEAR